MVCCYSALLVSVPVCVPVCSFFIGADGPGRGKAPGGEGRGQFLTVVQDELETWIRKPPPSQFNMLQLIGRHKAQLCMGMVG